MEIIIALLLGLCAENYCSIYPNGTEGIYVEIHKPSSHNSSPKPKRCGKISYKGDFVWLPPIEGQSSLIDAYGCGTYLDEGKL